MYEALSRYPLAGMKVIHNPQAEVVSECITIDMMCQCALCGNYLSLLVTDTRMDRVQATPTLPCFSRKPT